MKQKRENAKSAGSEAPRKRSPGDLAVLALFFILPAILIFWVAQRSPRAPVGNRDAAAAPNSPANPTQALAKSQATAPAALLQTNAPNTLLTASVPPSPASPPPAVLPELPGDPQQLVASLSEIDFSAGPITPDQVAQWKRILQKLVQQGAAAVPAIREFLAKNVDVDFDSSKGGDALGYPTVRLALFDALRQISGPESIAASVQVLQATADPKEIAILTKNLEQQAQGQHRKEAVAAAREALAQAARGQLEGPDVGPLFEVLQQYGGPGVASDLELVGSKWNFYSTIALGGLPGGAGIPALTRMAQDTSIQNVMALRILAQLAGTYPEAKAVLIGQVRSNTMVYTAWAGVQAALGGEIIEYGAPVLGAVANPLGGPGVRAYHINYGNQNYRTVSGSENWSQAQIKQQIALVDQFIAVDPSLETLQFLQDTRLALAGRLSK